MDTYKVKGTCRVRGSLGRPHKFEDIVRDVDNVDHAHGVVSMRMELNGLEIIQIKETWKLEKAPKFVERNITPTRTIFEFDNGRTFIAILNELGLWGGHWLKGQNMGIFEDLDHIRRFVAATAQSEE